MQIEKEIEQFAQLMQKELTANENKGDWHLFLNERDILHDLEYHKAKLMFALKFDNEDDIKEYAADCANCLLMLLNSKGIFYEIPKREESVS